ncbi:hypothetical protein SAMN05720759_11435 [Fibrobacter sp. UWB12]|nr:hypothetical protein SAMN05720759_11435 [Fibrobacter sp. UWB12]
MLEGQIPQKIKDVASQQPELNDSGSKASKSSILDLHCRDERDNKWLFILECFRKSPVDSFKKVQIKSMVLTEEEQDYLAWIKMKGVKQGAEEKAREMAKKMLVKGFSIQMFTNF